MSNKEKNPPEKPEKPLGLPGQEPAEELEGEEEDDPVKKRLKLFDDIIVHKEYQDNKNSSSTSQSAEPTVTYQIMSKSSSLPVMTLSPIGPNIQQNKPEPGNRDYREAGHSNSSTSKRSISFSHQERRAARRIPDYQEARPSRSPTKIVLQDYQEAGPSRSPTKKVLQDYQEAGPSRSPTKKVLQDYQEAGPSRSPTKKVRHQEAGISDPSASQSGSPKKKQKTIRQDYQEAGPSSATTSSSSRSHSIADSYFKTTLDEPIDPTAGLSSLFSTIPSANPPPPGQNWFEREIAEAFLRDQPPLHISGSPSTSAGFLGAAPASMPFRMPCAENITTEERVRSFFNSPSASSFITPPLCHQKTTNPTRKRSRAEATITREPATMTKETATTSQGTSALTKDSEIITRARATISREIASISRSSPTDILSPTSPLPNYPLEVKLRSGETIFLNTIENTVRTFFNPFNTYPSYDNGLSMEEEEDLCRQESMLSTEAHVCDHQIVIQEIEARLEDYVPEVIKWEKDDEEKKKKERIYQLHKATLLKIRARRVRPEESAAALAAIIAVTPSMVDEEIAKAGIGSSSSKESSGKDNTNGWCCRLLGGGAASAEDYINNHTIHDVRYETNYILNRLYSFRMGFDWIDGHHEMILPEFENMVANNVTMRFIFESFINQGTVEFARLLLPLIHITLLFSDLLDEMLDVGYNIDNWHNCMLIVFICVEMAAHYRLLVKTGRMDYVKFLYFQRCLFDFFNGAFAEWMLQMGGWGLYIRQTFCGYWKDLKHPDPPTSPDEPRLISPPFFIPSPPGRRSPPGPPGPPSPPAPAPCAFSA